MEKKTIIAVVVSLIILLVWSRFFSPRRTPPGEREVTPVPEREERAQEIEREERVAPRVLPLDEEAKPVIVVTDSSRIVLTTQGARVREWSIKEKEDKVDLVLEKLRSEGILPLDLEIEGFPGLSHAQFQSEEEKLVLEKGEEGEVLFNYRLGKGLVLSKIYRFSSGGYLQALEVRIHNRSKVPQQIGELTLLWQAGLSTDEALLKENRKMMKAQARIDGAVNRKLKPGTYTGEIDWMGVTNRYFLAAFINTRKDFSTGRVGSFDKYAPTVSLIAPSSILEPNQVKSYKVDLLVGYKDYIYLKNLNIGLERTLDFGVFGFLSVIFLSILKFFYGVTYNYGFSIIILTCILQVFTFPLTRKSFKSMEAMKSLQPKINELKLKYKNDPKRLNVEMMNLYRSRKMNPFGGCLPMLLQIPIFWALFTMLRNAVELRHSPFIFWIRDLSMKDPVYVLPILMGATMFLQQKLTATGDPAQSKMMMFMPVFFTVIFLNFPSGLVLYWLMNNILTLSMQLIMKRKAKINA
ncbi:MAG: membrane protein insertase YidC [Elusimicrobiota bacterium]|nr:membrane protein insertase YidC [Elusimicrobiota bacterium]